MIKRQHALAQLNLLRHADNPAVRAAAETVTWLNDRLESNEICQDRFSRIVHTQYCILKDIDRTDCQVCSLAIKDLLDSGNARHENI